MKQMRTGLMPLSVLAAAAAASSLVGATPAGLRSIYVNGSDISSARNLEMRNVDIQINEHGDVYIVAPHYQVTEEDSYVPLSKYVQGLKLPAHKPPMAMGTTPSTQQPAPQPMPTAPIPKAGEPVSPPAADQTTQPPSPTPTAAPVAAGDPPPPSLPEDGAVPVGQPQDAPQP